MDQILATKLNDVISKIGEARATGNADALGQLRERRRELEEEAREMAAEQAYLAQKAVTDTASAEQTALESKLNDFTLQSDSVTAAFHLVESSLNKMAEASKEFDEAVTSFMGAGNPLLILNSAWKSLSPEKQRELSNQIHESLDLRNRTPNKLAAAETLDKLNGRLNSLAMQMAQFRVTATTPTKRGRSFTTKSTGHKVSITIPIQPHSNDRDHGMPAMPRFDRNKPKGEQFVGNQAA